MIRLMKIEFDPYEELRTATFELDADALNLIRSSLGFTPAYREFGHIMIDLYAAQIRELSADLANRRSPTALISEVSRRMSRVVEAFDGDDS